jgi:hypothetical protein
MKHKSIKYKLCAQLSVKKRLGMHNWAIVMDLLAQGPYFGDSHLLQK